MAMASPKNKPAAPRSMKAAQDGGILDFDFSGLAGRALSVAITIIVVLAVFASVLPDVFTNVGDINNVFTNNASALNNSLGESIAPIFPLIITVVVLFGVVGVIVAGVRSQME